MISVIIPVYNVEKYLRECLDSVLRQTCSDFELLLIDDGSRDSSGKICDEYASKDSRISVIHKENGGVSAARNLGLQNAKGEWIAFVDADDVIADTYLEKLYNGIQEGDADVCLCKYNQLRENVITPREEKALVTYVNDKGNDAYFQQFLSHYITVLCKDDASYLAGTVWRMLFRKSSFPHPFPEDISMSEDFIYVMRNFLGVNRINVVDEYLYNYRENNASAMANYRKNFLTNQKAYLRELEDILHSLDMTDKCKTERTLATQRALSCAFLFGNEIRFRKQVKSFKDNIRQLKKDELYSSLKLINALRIKHKAMRIKYLGVWGLIKLQLYRIL